MIHSDGGDDSDDKGVQWFTIARQEGFVIIEGDGRLTELVKGVGADPTVNLSSMCFCAVARCRAGGRRGKLSNRLPSNRKKTTRAFQRFERACRFVWH